MNSGGLLGGVNWAKAQDIGLSLLVSPMVGFVCTALLFLLLKALIRKPELYAAPDPQKAPPWWIRRHPLVHLHRREFRAWLQ